MPSRHRMPLELVQIRMRVAWCGYLYNRANTCSGQRMWKFHRAQQAFSLIEVCFAIALSAVLVVASTALFVNAHFLFTRSSEILEDSAMTMSCARMLRQDIHAASSSSFLGDSLILYEINSKRYIYSVNAEHQLVRYQYGGGTAVISAHVQQMSVAQSGGIVLVTIQLDDGTKTTFAAQLGGHVQ